MFTNTTLVRKNPDGSENERVVVPVAFGEKEKYWQALQGDPQHDKHIQITVPVMAYNFINMKYDASRKQQSTLQNFNINASKNLLTNYMAVPYNYDFELYIYVRTIYDGFQIIEQILPFFTPDYTLRVNLMPSMNIVKDVPVILNDIRFDVSDYEGERESESRFVEFTLNFTAKSWLFGPVQQGFIIKEAITNIYNWKNEDGRNLYLVVGSGGTGTFQPNEVIYQDNRLETSNATAVVVDWNSATKRLLVDQVQGTFTTGETITGVTSHAQWQLINYEIVPQIVEKIDITVKPPTANIGDPWTANVAKTYFNTAR